MTVPEGQAMTLDSLVWEELRTHAALLERENRRYAEFFEYAPDAYVITDGGGSVCEANLAALELLGLPREEVLGRALGGYVAQDRASVRRPDGATVRVECSVRPIPLRKGEGRGLCWLMRLAG